VALKSFQNMSYDDSDDNDGEWEVVDIVHTTTSVKSDKKNKPAKKEDVEKLAADIQAQLSMKTTQDTQQILLLEQKMKQQQQMSEHQLSTIQSKLNQLTKMQQQQEQQQRDLDQQRRDLEARQKQQLLEQQIAIQSLSDNQMLTQKQLIEAHQQLQCTQNAAKTANDNIESLQALQQRQALQQQLTEQQTLDLQQQIQHQQQLSQLAQISAAQQLNELNQHTNHLLNTIPQPIPPSAFNLPPPPQNQQKLQHHANNNGHSNGNISNGKNNNNNSNGNESNNSWLPSFFAFGANQNKKQTNNNNNTMTNQVNHNGNRHGVQVNNGNHMQSDTNLQDMDMAGSPPLQPLVNLNAMNASNQFHVAEEKSNILIEEDDEDVLGWQNDYGTQSVNPLSQNPALLKTKGAIGEGKFTPNEKRQCGWILQNKSNSLLKMSARLEAMGGDQEQYGMKVTTEKVYEFSLKPNEEVYILIEVEAPGVVGRYCAFYQLVIENGMKVGEVLEVLCEVEAQFSAKREEKIAQIVKMGFNDRKKVIATLQKHKWNVQQSVDQLIGL